MAKTFLRVDSFKTKLSVIESRVSAPANVHCHLSMGVRKETTMMYNAAVKKANALMKLISAMKKTFVADIEIAKQTYVLKKTFAQYKQR